jgi:hypothetical protein
MSAVMNAWSALELERRQESGWHVRRIHPEASCELLAGIRQPGSMPGLLLELAVDDVPPGLALPRSNGFSVEPVMLGGGQSGRVRFALALSDRSYETVFTVLCEDVATAAAHAASARGALRDWTGRLHVWQAFMARYGPGGMSESAVLGLIGELLLLRDEFVPLLGARAALDAWSGPLGEPNDFALPGGFVEVKTTSRQSPETLEIANTAQLDDTRGPILLAHVRMRPSADGVALPQLVTEVRSAVISQASDRITDFDNQLMALGYVPAQAELYTATYAHDRTNLFEVTGQFPRLKRSEIPAGVRNCSYTIELDACAPYLANWSALVEMTGDSRIG